MNTLPVIAGVEITTDAQGRFNLNALHKASGEAEHKRPSKWLSTEPTKELIAELESQSPSEGLAQKAVNSVKGGSAPGTFAHELLAVSYAGWISPAFQLKVNQVFLDYRNGRLQPIPQFDPATALNDPATMRSLLLGYTEKVLALEDQIKEIQPKADALDRIAKADGSLCITDAAKLLQIAKPKDLFCLLQQKSWIFRRPGTTAWLGYQDKVQKGLLEHKVTEVSRSDGSNKVAQQVRVTPKGIALLSQLINHPQAH
ncbi:phage antirepressor KilAC domain-containing protein [Rheinheimera sp. MMS21-TC3]|uniref:phage antirepressor KilAC domain-containing protein n=1 Tax=Rheinheimera sp. MMS21-TC3 TaxID=3072790 RepID=UPI0028C3C368|nr:phage antirepressor KilAC domain-containing protein [Rheinheimera sp. MMS21-TC3]WNO60895.1 phage antirepressor KilAC domain-containing protein [Rheinheimera sp. MMS21-TC3]